MAGLTADLDVSEPSIKKFTLFDSNLYNESLGLVPRQQDLSDIESKNLSFNVSSGQDASTIYNSESLFQNQPSYYEFDDDEGTEDEDYEDAYTAESEAYLDFDDDDDEECGYEAVSSNITGTSEHSYGYEFDEEEDEDFAEGSMSFDFDEDDDNAEYEDVVPEGYTYDEDDVEYEDLSSDDDADAEYEDVGGYSFDDDDADVEYEDLSSDDDGDIEYEDVSSDDDDDIEYEDVVPEGYVYAGDEDDDDVEYEDLTVYDEDDEDDEDDVEYEDVGTYDSDEDEEYEDEEYEDVGSYTSDEYEDEDEEYEDVGTYDSDEDENDEDYDDVYDEYSDDAVLGGIDVESIVQSIESGNYSTPVIQSARAVTVEPALTKPKENPFIYSDKQADSVKAGVNSALSGIFNRVTKLVSDRKSH